MKICCLYVANVRLSFGFLWLPPTAPGVLTRSRRDSQGDAFLRLHRSGFHEGDGIAFSGGEKVMVIGVGLDILGISKVRRVS